MSLSNNQKNELLFVGFNQDYGEWRVEKLGFVRRGGPDVNLTLKFFNFRRTEVSSVQSKSLRAPGCTNVGHVCVCTMRSRRFWVYRFSLSKWVRILLEGTPREHLRYCRGRSFGEEGVCFTTQACLARQQSKREDAPERPPFGTHSTSLDQLGGVHSNSFEVRGCWLLSTALSPRNRGKGCRSSQRYAT